MVHVHVVVIGMTTRTCSSHWHNNQMKVGMHFVVEKLLLIAASAEKMNSDNGCQGCCTVCSFFPLSSPHSM